MDADNSIFIDAVGIGGYRSFGPIPQRLGPFSKLNICVGQNNSGKSNILLFLLNHYRAARRSTRSSVRDWKFEPLDNHFHDASMKITVEFGLLLGGPSHTRHLESLGQDQQKTRHPSILALIEKVYRSKTLTRDGDALAWFPYEGRPGQGLTLTPRVLEDIAKENVLSRDDWYTLWNRLTDHHNGDLRQHWIPHTLQLLAPIHDEIPPIELVPAIRRVGDAGSTIEGFGGAGIIERLVRLQNPPHDQQHLREHFNQVNAFLQAVIGNSSAVLEIPSDRDMINVHMDRRTFPLASVGMGIHEVIIMAAAATVMRNQILCIEEPELHLHPVLQKKLARYLQEQTDNQYFITTHSAHLLDVPGAAVFHVRHRDGCSLVEPVRTARGTLSVCADLGYRASDLLQANSIIWVEGPSDRVYLNHWLHDLAPDLVEGLHYSIMFYGGRLLSHLSADDIEVDRFVSLRRLNRHLAIVIDSDRDSEKGLINETKERVMAEFDQGPGFAWVTAGREIENYVEAAELHEAINAVHPGATHVPRRGRYDRCLQIRTTAQKRESADKMKVAHKVTEREAHLDIYDLRERMTRLVAFILVANGESQARGMQVPRVSGPLE